MIGQKDFSHLMRNLDFCSLAKKLCLFPNIRTTKITQKALKSQTFKSLAKFYGYIHASLCLVCLDTQIARFLACNMAKMFLCILFLCVLLYYSYELSRLMGKPTICIGENKDADQLCGNCEADQRLCFRYTDSTLPLLLKSEVSSFSLLL